MKTKIKDNNILLHYIWIWSIIISFMIILAMILILTSRIQSDISCSSDRVTYDRNMNIKLEYDAPLKLNNSTISCHGNIDAPAWMILRVMQ